MGDNIKVLEDEVIRLARADPQTVATEEEAREGLRYLSTLRYANYADVLKATIRMYTKLPVPDITHE